MPRRKQKTTNFVVGQSVICVDASHEDLVLGRTYIIKSISTSYGKPFLYLDGNGGGWRPDRFEAVTTTTKPAALWPPAIQLDID